MKYKEQSTATEYHNPNKNFPHEIIYYTDDHKEEAIVAKVLADEFGEKHENWRLCVDYVGARAFSTKPPYGKKRYRVKVRFREKMDAVRFKLVYNIEN